VIQNNNTGIEKFETYGMECLSDLSTNEILLANSYFSLMALSYFRGASKYWNLKESYSIILMVKNKNKLFKEM